MKCLTVSQSCPQAATKCLTLAQGSQAAERSVGDLNVDKMVIHFSFSPPTACVKKKYNRQTDSLITYDNIFVHLRRDSKLFEDDRRTRRSILVYLHQFNLLLFSHASIS